MITRNTDTAEHLRLRSKSYILNNQDTPAANVALMNKSNVEFELLRITGNDKGQYFWHQEWHIAYLPFVRARIEELKQSFIQLELQAKNMGKEPPEMPPEMEEKLNNYIAQEDILIEEQTELEKRLKAYSEIVQKVDDSHVLEFGLICVGHFWGSRATNRDMINVLKDIDGQNVAEIDGVLCIDDSRSVYDGMTLPDYRRLAKQWVNDCLKAEQERLKRLQAEAKAKNEPIPGQLPFVSRKKVNKNSLPKWPAWAVNRKIKAEAK